MEDLYAKKIALVDNKLLCADILRLIFEFVEVLIDYPKVMRLNESFACILDSDFKMGDDDWWSDTIPEGGRGEEVKGDSDLEVPCMAATRKRGLGLIENTDKAPVKKPRRDENSLHVHCASCWRENTPTARPSSSSV